MAINPISLLLLATVLVVLLLACGGGSQPKATYTSLPTTVQPSPTPARISMVTLTGKTTNGDRDQTWSFTAEEGTFVRVKGGPAEGSNIDVAFELFGPGG